MVEQDIYSLVSRKRAALLIYGEHHSRHKYVLSQSNVSYHVVIRGGARIITPS